MSEMDDMRRRWAENQRREAEEELAAQAGRISDFTAHCAGLGLALDKTHFQYLRPIGTIAQYADIISTLCPELETDKDGLYDFNRLRDLFQITAFTGGLLQAPNFILMAHPWFRRSMHAGAGWAPRFIELFWRLDLPATRARIALDPDRVRIDLNRHGMIELDTWFGAAFSQDIAGIKDGMAELRPPAYLDPFDLEIFFGCAYSLHIKWSTEGNIKTFQAEAFLIDKVLAELEDDLWHPVRYVHAEYDLEANEFRHFDGAIHFYQAPDYRIMRDADLNYNLKHGAQIKAPAKKLFRLDDHIPVTTWLELTAHFFPHNPLIIEYFEGRYPQQIEETLARVRAALEKEGKL